MTAGFRELGLNVPADLVWAAMVAPGRRDWYYRLVPEGAFVAGGHVSWLQTDGKSAEESDVLEVVPGSRLVMRSRFVFAPSFAAAAPHTMAWEVNPMADGSLVRISWDASGPVVRLLESESDSMLQGLRLETDPAARAELERLPEIGAVEIRDVTPDLVAEYQRFFDDEAFRDYPAWQSCYCMETHRTQNDDEWGERTAEDNRRDMTDLVRRGQVDALLAFADGKPVGWCNFGETTRLSGLMRRFDLDAPAHEGVGSVACFVIAARYRGHGIAAQLLDGAVQRLRTRGLRAVEAYPARADDSTHGNFRGPLSMFLRAGFETYGEVERFLIVRKSL